MKRKLLLALLTITLAILAAVPAAAESVSASEGLHLDSIEDWYGVTLTKNDDGNNTYTLELAKTYASDVNIYSYCNDWYKEWKDKITRVIIDANFDSIGDKSFYEFGSLLSVTLPSSVKQIGKNAFYNCRCLSDIDLSNVTSVGASAFFNCGPDPMNFNFRPSITAVRKAAACSEISVYAVRPDAPEGTTAMSQFTEAYEEVLRILDELDLDGKTDMEKYKAIYSWVTENVSYDYEALNYAADTSRYNYAGTIHSAVFARQAICHGYSLLLRIMLNQTGVDCFYVSGLTTEGNHAWNMIKIDGKWYLSDSTWDAPKTKLEEYKAAGLPSFAYCLRSSTFFYNASEGQHYQPASTDMFKALCPISTADYYARFKSGKYTFMKIDDHAVIYKYSGKDKSLTLPETVTYNGEVLPVTEIYVNAFKDNTTLTTLTIPATIRKIGAHAFDNCIFLSKVTFNGTSQQFKEILIGGFNSCLCDQVINCTDTKYKDPNSLSNATIKLSPKSFTYDGKSHIPAVKITMPGGKVLTENIDYRLVSAYHDKLVASKKVYIYALDIIGLGDYSRFAVTAEYTINPAPTKLKKLTSGKKTMTVKWTKKTTQVGGYQIQYALNKKFTKGKKTVKVKGCKNASRKITKLKSKKVYYVRVRTYKYAYGDYTEKTLYSSWSNIKSVKVK